MEYYRLTIPIPKQPLRLLKFRISTALLLTAILALALAWCRDHKKLYAQLHKLQNPTTSWSTSQVTGPPNTKGFGDLDTAWASLTPDGAQEWLDLEYDQSVVPTAILIHETYNPGAVIKVTYISYWGSEKILWQGQDPTPVGSSGGVSRLPVSAGIKTGHIKVYIDSPAVPGWIEIDAVGLEYGNKQVIWATDATSSSTWATQMYGPYGTPNAF